MTLYDSVCVLIYRSSVTSVKSYRVKSVIVWVGVLHKVSLCQGYMCSCVCVLERASLKGCFNNVCGVCVCVCMDQQGNIMKSA